MVITICPSCEGKITLEAPVKFGQRVRCTHCQEDLEVIETDPIELDWAYDEDDWEDDWDDDDDDWEDEEEDDDA